MQCVVVINDPSVSDVIQEMDDPLITGYSKLITGFQKIEFYNHLYRTVWLVTYLHTVWHYFSRVVWVSLVCSQL